MEVYKIMCGNEKVDRRKFYSLSPNTRPRGHPIKVDVGRLKAGRKKVTASCNTQLNSRIRFHRKSKSPKAAKHLNSETPMVVKIYEVPVAHSVMVP